MKKCFVFLAILPMLMANSCIFNNHPDDHHSHPEDTRDPDEDNSFVHQGEITTTQIWEGEHWIDDWVQIKDGGKVTIKAGATIYMSRGAWLQVEDGGALIVDGLEGTGYSVLFTSAEDVPGPGDWSRISIENSAAKTCELHYVTFEYGGTESEVMLYINNKVKMDNVTFRSGMSYGLQLGGDAQIDGFTNTRFESMGSAELIFTNVNRLAEIKNFHRDTLDIGRIVADSGEVNLSGTWGPYDTPVVLGDWTTINGATSAADLGINNVQIQMQHNGWIRVEKGRLNMDGVNFTTVDTKKYWDSIHYTGDSLASTINNCTFRDGNSSFSSNYRGNGYLVFDDGSDVTVSGVSFLDTQDSRSGICYVKNDSNNTSINNIVGNARLCD